MSTPPDRFTRRVQAVQAKQHGKFYPLNAVRLLKAEHAAVVRLVKAMRRHTVNEIIGKRHTHDKPAFANGYLSCVTDLLLTLTARGRGKG